MKKEEKKKKLFGRNLFTILFVVVIVVVVGFIVGMTAKNISTASSKHYQPFKTNDKGEALTSFIAQDKQSEVSVIDGKKFNDFGIYLKCIDSTNDESGTNGWNSSAGTASYKLAAIKNKTTEDLNIQGNKVSVGLCLMADWMGWTGFMSYASTSVYTITLSETLADAKKATSSTYKRSFTVSNVNKLPCKIDLFPFGMTLTNPDIYLYLSYTTKNNKTKTYILKYNYNLIYEDEYNAFDLSGSIVR